MAMHSGQVTSAGQLLREAAAFLIDPGNFGNKTAWALMSPAALTASTTEVILKGTGDGEDEIYVGMRLDPAVNGQQDISLNGYAGYDPALKWWEQPGAIHWWEEDGSGAAWGPKLPVLALAADVTMNYWLSADSYHFTLTVELSNQYETMYLGFMKPVAIDRQYPYPLVVGGGAPAGTAWAAHAAPHIAYLGADGERGVPSLVVRRPDGVWEAGGDVLRVWPSNAHPVDTFPVYNKDAREISIEDHMLYPFMLYEHNRSANEPTGWLGELRGVHWLGNRADLATLDVVMHEGVPHKVFNNVYDRADDAYYCVQWE